MAVEEIKDRSLVDKNMQTEMLDYLRAHMPGMGELRGPWTFSPAAAKASNASTMSSSEDLDASDAPLTAIPVSIPS